MSGDTLTTMKNVYDSIKEPEVAWSETMYVPGGCPECNNTGFKGRIGVFEAVLSDQQVESALEMNPSEREIKQAAEHQGIMDMAQDGVTKILKGTTSLDELQRVVDISSRSGIGDAPDGWGNDPSKEAAKNAIDITSIRE
jgi:type II secretory ATPase GspE/PulE/Tfp pilus assembly ATPase PilB-like protein